ncbi:MAG: ribosome silencing factor [Candidatus Riflebacteria bacterium]|nr:ribosome silencing factor [Candidatus Riflebacteria bacterium]
MNSDSKTLFNKVVSILDEKKVEDLVVLNLQKLVSYTDYFIIGTGLNNPHVQAMADAICAFLKEKDGKNPRMEGYQESNWILIDASDFIIHLFQPKVRGYYSLEDLWADAPRVDIKEILNK